MALPKVYSAGTASVENGATAVTGVGTAWAGTIREGDVFRRAGHSVRVASVESNDALTLAEDWPGTTLSGSDYEIAITYDGPEFELRVRELLEGLNNGGAGAIVAGTGVEVDATDPASPIVSLSDDVAEITVTATRYGAVADGSTPDAAAIQAALDAVELLGGGAVHLPAGTLILESTLRQPSNTTLTGQGMGVTILKAAASLPLDQSVITNKSNDGIERTNYDANIRILNLTIDGNAQNRSGTVTQGTGSCITLSTVKKCEIGFVRAINGALHNIDIMASVYFDDGDITHQPDGPSLGVWVHDCVSENPRYDDCFSTHNSGHVTFERCDAIIDRAVITDPDDWQYGFEVDEGSFHVAVIDCYAEGCKRGFVAKGHSTTHGAQYVSFVRCHSFGNGQGFWIYHNNGTGDANNWGVSIVDCTVESPIEDDITDGTLADWQSLIEINQSKAVSIRNLTLINPGDGSVMITGAECGDVNIDGVSIFGAATEDGSWSIANMGIFTIYNSLTSDAKVRIANVKSYATQTRPIIYLVDSDANHIFENIAADSSDNTVGLVRVGTVAQTGLIIRNLRGSGWAGLVYDNAQTRAYSNDYRQESGGAKFMALSTGSPESSVYAPVGAQLTVIDTGKIWRKNTAGSSNAGWGSIGDVVQSTVVLGSAVSLSSNSQTNVTSISLPPGEWEVSGNVAFDFGGSATASRSQASISQTSATMDITTGGAFASVGLPSTAAQANSSSNMSVHVSPIRISLSTTTTIYLVTRVTFGAGSAAAYGHIKAVRAA